MNGCLSFKSRLVCGCEWCAEFEMHALVPVADYLYLPFGQSHCFNNMLMLDAERMN